eukprot:TRINITY_DN4697_c0_g1_i1.p1 TRINITY_DN4697_c0_g1~~TRINITY_DN4697_c0_g1_i1.p1  ORF type:complete len:331 (+),score=67.72 TRINITY_DN4697_c0_g1_i1:19-1011(+)
MTLALVTGASGYIGGHLVKQLLDKGYKVRGTVRSLTNADAVEYLRKLDGADERLELVEADLLQPGSFDAAVAGCEHVYHTASPFFRKVDKPDDLIKPALEGTLNVLRACAKEPQVKRLVVTSSLAACVFGHDQDDDPSPLTESDWNNLSTAESDQPMHWYRASKVQAERACWDFLESERPSFSIVTINPPMVIGPWLPHYNRANESSMVIKEKLNGEATSVPPGGVGWIDVRDVAKAHINAMEMADAHGRYLICSEVLSHLEIAQLLKEICPDAPVCVDKPDKEKAVWTMDVSKASTSLGMTSYIPLKETMQAQIESLKANGHLTKSFTC